MELDLAMGQICMDKKYIKFWGVLGCYIFLVPYFTSTQRKLPQVIGMLGFIEKWWKRVKYETVTVSRDSQRSEIP